MIRDWLSIMELCFNPRWLHATFIVDKVVLEQLFPEFLQFSPISHHSIIAAYSSNTTPLTYARALTSQHIITSSVFKFGASSLTWHFAGYKESKLFSVWLPICAPCWLPSADEMFKEKYQIFFPVLLLIHVIYFYEYMSSYIMCNGFNFLSVK